MPTGGQQVVVVYGVGPDGKSLIPLSVDTSGILQVSSAVSSAMINPMNARDDLIVGGIAGTPEKLSAGLDGQVLTVDPITHHLIWKTPPTIDHAHLISGDGGALANYILANGTIPFTGNVGGVEPTEPQHLATKGYIDDALQLEIITADHSVITTGTEGVLPYTATKIRDLNVWTITEVNSGRGINVELHFVGIVGTPSSVWLRAYYNGGSHTIEVQHWNYIHSVWDTVQVLISLPAFVWTSWPLPDADEHVSGGESMIRFYHSASTTAGHHLYVDYCALVETQFPLVP